ncbi:MAG TPA: uL15 family ribosomal protein, partial [Candidatus Norongarragalinales archaeon]|nr:uL15 family ribosomal protein [Candidatus Norongarragalinales archaeon]
NKVSRGIHGFSNPSRRPLKTVTLGRLIHTLSSFPKDASGVYQIVLPKTSVVSGGVFDVKAHVKAVRFSASAKESIEKAGGSANPF